MTKFNKIFVKKKKRKRKERIKIDELVMKNRFSVILGLNKSKLGACDKMATLFHVHSIYYYDFIRHKKHTVVYCVENRFCFFELNLSDVACISNSYFTIFWKCLSVAY